MERMITTVTERFQSAALDFVQQVFTEAEGTEEGKKVRALTEEIRGKKFYLPELELIMVNELEEIIGYAMFSRFDLEGKFDQDLLLLSPVAVKTALQRQHISKELLEYGMEKARRLGYKAVMVEGDPRNYRARGFETAANHGILPGKTVHLPHIDCLMVKELVPGTLDHIHGTVEYTFYETLTIS